MNESREPQGKAGSVRLPDLPHDVLLRRLLSARVLAGMTQEKAGEKFHELGFGLLDIARLERALETGEYPAKPSGGLTPARIWGLSEIYGVPRYWFTARDPFADEAREDQA
jgi:hypothetical protein